MLISERRSFLTTLWSFNHIARPRWSHYACGVLRFSTAPEWTRRKRRRNLALKRSINISAETNKFQSDCTWCLDPTLLSSWLGLMEHAHLRLLIKLHVRTREHNMQQLSYSCCKDLGIRLQWGLWRESKATPLGALVNRHIPGWMDLTALSAWKHWGLWLNSEKCYLKEYMPSYMLFLTVSEWIPMGSISGFTMDHLWTDKSRIYPSNYSEFT